MEGQNSDRRVIETGGRSWERDSWTNEAGNQQTPVNAKDWIGDDHRHQQTAGQERREERISTQVMVKVELTDVVGDKRHSGK